MPDIDSMTGRELDAAVAEKVFESRTARSCTTGEVNPWVPGYSKDWSGVALVVERLWQSGKFCDIRPRIYISTHTNEHIALCEIFEHGWRAPKGIYYELVKIEDPAKAMQALATAVCRAALKAREAKHA